jgi:curved DNA-binding protein CbpA
LTDARMRTPRPVPDRRDLRGMSLSPTDGFVLSRVDGTLSEHDLVQATGLPESQVLTSLAALESLGLITFPNGQPSPAAPAAPGPAQTSAAAPPARQTMPSISPEDDPILAENVDLDEDMKRAVVATHGRLARQDHYALLGVDRQADRKGIKRAYFELAGKFHPDKYFRKNLGSFKVRMEAIFTRITVAHETLSDREKRAEYDVYLEERRLTRSAEDLTADALDEARRIEQAVERELARERAATPVPGVPAAPTARAPSDPGPPAGSLPAPPSVDVAARRDALARRLLGGRPGMSTAPPARGPSIGPPTPAPSPVASAMDAIRRRYEERLSLAKTAEARRYAENAATALKAGDVVAAANAYRVAVTLAPGDAGLARVAQETQAKADVVLGETYAKQADYEERNGQWAEASRSWSRVCKGRPDDAQAHEKAASALLMANLDLVEASRLAKRACDLEPERSAFRVTLAKIYVAAGFGQSARRELETAARLAPRDDTIQAMLKRL